MIPVDLLVTEARPAVRLALLDKFIERTVARAVKQRLARVAVVKGELAGSGRLLLKKGGRALPVGAVLGVVAVVVANAISSLRVAIPPEVLLARNLSTRGTEYNISEARVIRMLVQGLIRCMAHRAGTEFLLRHHLLRSHHHRRLKALRAAAEKIVEKTHHRRRGTRDERANREAVYGGE